MTDDEKRKKAFQLIQVAKENKRLPDTKFQEMEHDPAIIFDQQGRLVRW